MVHQTACSCEAEVAKVEEIVMNGDWAAGN